MNDEIKLIFETHENDFDSVNKWFKHDPFLVIRDEIHDCLMIFEKQLKTYHFLVVEKNEEAI